MSAPQFVVLLPVDGFDPGEVVTLDPQRRDRYLATKAIRPARWIDPVTCEACDKVFAGSETYAAHIRRHPATEPVPTQKPELSLDPEPAGDSAE